MAQPQLIVALLVGLALVVFLILKTKVQAFPALLIAAITVGVIAGLPLDEVVSTISGGFGSTLSSIGIIIGLGIMMGKILEVTGAAKRMAISMLKLFGIQRAEWVMALSGFLVSIPVFCDSGFVILSELAKEFSRVTKKSMVTLGCSLALGLYLTHNLVPPTPGPLAAAAIMGVDIGMMIPAGVILALLLLIVLIPYIRYVGRKCPAVFPEGMREDTLQEVSLEAFDESKLPSTALSFMPIIVPILMILTKTVSAAMGYSSPVITLLCDPITAVMTGLLISIYTLMRKSSREDTVKLLEDSLSDAGLVMLITGAGGALGAVLRTSGVGDYVANLIASSGFPAILVPIIIGILLKLSQGSGTVAIITTASIVAPMLSVLQLHPLVALLAVCIAPACASYFNDSYFWVVTRFSGMDVKTGMKSWTSVSAMAGIVGSIMVVILSLFLKP